MDSASGSMQSSSGGDEDYDSRADSIPAFLNNSHYPNSFNPDQTHNNSGQAHMLDPLYFDPNPSTFQRSPSLSNTNPLLNLDMAWSNKPGRSADLSSFMPHPPSSTLQSQPFGSGQTKIGTFQQNLPQESNSRGLVSVSGGGNDQDQVQPQAHTNSNNVRNPKKRSRASRRAPTTVLTTDTTNFRAMVQEFTGIPAPPFSSSPFPRPRLDLFSSSSSSSLRSPHFDPPFPPYLLRPFPHKLHPTNPFLSSSSAPLSSFPTTTISSSSLVDPVTNSPNSVSYQLSPLNMHTPPILSFQSILQPPPKFTAQNNSSVSILAPNKSQASLEIPPPPPPPPDSHLKMGVFEELGLTNTSHVNAAAAGFHRNLVSPSSDGAMTRSRDDNNFHGIVNYLASSESNFHGDKGTECVAAAAAAGVPRSEGMVESWINCSSD